MAKPWAKYEIGFIRHPKFLALTGNAIALWWEAKNFCDEHHTDGLFPREALRTFRFNGGKSVDALTRTCGVKADGQSYAPLWEPQDIGGVPHFKMHDYLDHNDCREAVLKRFAVADVKREESRQRQQDFRARRNAERNALHNSPSNVHVTLMSQGEQIQIQNQNQKVQEHKSGGGSKRPIYTSDRFCVFEWQLDELSRILGPHVEAFDLHAFFDLLTQQSRTHGLVIPKAEVWPWLQAQVSAEARTRGLPMACGVADDDAEFEAMIRKGPSVRP